MGEHRKPVPPEERPESPPGGSYAWDTVPRFMEPPCRQGAGPQESIRVRWVKGAPCQGGASGKDGKTGWFQGEHNQMVSGPPDSSLTGEGLLREGSNFLDGPMWERETGGETNRR